MVRASARLIGAWLHDLAVDEMHDAIRPFGHCGVVAHHEQRHAVPFARCGEQIQRPLCAVGIECAGWLVGEQQPRTIGERAGERDGLSLPAGQLRGQMVRTVAEADFLQELRAPSSAFTVIHAGSEQRRLDVAAGAQVREQEVVLKDEPDHIPAELDRVSRLGHGLPVDEDRAAVWAIKASDQVQQRALPGPRGPGDGHKLRCGDGEGNVAERTDRTKRSDDLSDVDVGTAGGAGKGFRGSFPSPVPDDGRPMGRAHWCTVTGQSRMTEPSAV